MLYLINLGIITLWLIVVLCKRKLSTHAVVTAYVIGVGCADLFEGLFNLFLGLYKFPTQLRADPYYANELGVIFADFLILPFTLIVFVYYASRSNHPWRISLPFAIAHIVMELVYLQLGYMTYVHWHIWLSAFFYVAGFRFGAYLAPRIATYDPPVPYRVRLLCFSHMILMWTSAVFALPILKLYRFKPGLFQDFMADCRFAELVSGDILSVLCTIFVPMTPRKRKPLVFAAIALVGAAVAVFSDYMGWLVYYRWNLFLTILRYVVPVGIIMLYDRWEANYKARAIADAA
ncbi:hypothetical protein [Paenibacillus arenilitoris]|uniref:Uncharacterized protein n=1 Tax=Paenibacillus arenilitoris TaxID=2772299 RepID=A0A927H7B2_9BACL|nr:hypothetical protein [Paenibacillus arenilitoris]MBD2870347.1 hypothetical protein [Paenibacillus arenilitoris]